MLDEAPEGLAVSTLPQRLAEQEEVVQVGLAEVERILAALTGVESAAPLPPGASEPAAVA